MAGTAGAAYSPNDCTTQKCTNPSWSEYVAYEHGYLRFSALNATALAYEYVVSKSNQVIDRNLIIQVSSLATIFFIFIFILFYFFIFFFFSLPIGFFCTFIFGFTVANPTFRGACQDLSQAWIVPSAPTDASSRTLIIVLSVMAAFALAVLAASAYRRHQQSNVQETGDFLPLRGTAA